MPRCRKKHLMSAAEHERCPTKVDLQLSTRSSPVGLRGGARHLQLVRHVRQEAAEGHVEVVLQKGVRRAPDVHVHHLGDGQRDGEAAEGQSEVSAALQRITNKAVRSHLR